MSTQRAMIALIHQVPSHGHCNAVGLLMPINQSELMAECVEESSESAVIVTLTFIVLPSPQDMNSQMDGALPFLGFC